MNEYVIKVDSISKRYRIGNRAYALTLMERLNRVIENTFRSAENPKSKARRRVAPQTDGNGLVDFWALRDVSFAIRSGEVVGLIGRNGAGKSTLLKILSRITNPTTGSAEIHGRVGSLLQVGTGFHPDLTGRENIYLSGAILGMSRNEIGLKFDEIVEFANVAKFIDTPIKYYSSGMGMRLAFSLAANLNCDIIFLDEVWGVGDENFANKSRKKMEEIVKSGRTILLVSHSLGTVESLCTRCIVLERGEVLRDGMAGQVVDFYRKAYG